MELIDILRRYSIYPKQDQSEKNSCFLIYGTSPPPLENISIAEKYQARDCPNIMVIYAKYSVRKHNTKIWGNSGVISIKKKFRKNLFYAIDETELEFLKNVKKDSKIKGD
ncbi:hypothetical protein LOD99_2921 [Oopsacas minuta]|uniref:Uncharacterized protein n=1 Tax=Oopsacas minuta TaxID=111878 RepID=A0AAV7JYP8_9METZ|nr:hypothetical protein LOD99_2921 [Oopsacas minuta]